MSEWTSICLSVCLSVFPSAHCFDMKWINIKRCSGRKRARQTPGYLLRIWLGRTFRTFSLKTFCKIAFMWNLICEPHNTSNNNNNLASCNRNMSVRIGYPVFQWWERKLPDDDADAARDYSKTGQLPQSYRLSLGRHFEWTRTEIHFSTCYYYHYYIITIIIITLQNKCHKRTAAWSIAKKPMWLVLRSLGPKAKCSTQV